MSTRPGVGAGVAVDVLVPDGFVPDGLVSDGVEEFNEAFGRTATDVDEPQAAAPTTQVNGTTIAAARSGRRSTVVKAGIPERMEAPADYCPSTTSDRNSAHHRGRGQARSAVP